MYSKIEVYGQCDVNYLHIKNGIETSDEITEVVNQGLSSPEWEDSTIMLANYDENINGTSLQHIDGVVVGYQIQRLDTKKNIMSSVAQTTEGVLQDYLVNHANTYQYYIFPVIENETTKVRTLGAPIVTDEITPDWDTCTIVGLIEVGENEYRVDPNNIWKFQLNVEHEPYTLNTDKAFTDGFGRFPKRTQGKKKYVTGSTNSIMGTIECTTDKIDINTSDIERWEDFCYSSNLKLFNDMRGRILPIDISAVTTGYFENFDNSPLVTNISFTQMADVNEITVYGLDGE